MDAKVSPAPALKWLILAFAFVPLTAHGTTVTTTSDEDDGSLGGGSGISLREAVKYSTAGDTITFAPALSGGTIRFTGGPITIAKSLAIDASALPARITLSGDKTGDGRTADDTRVLQIGLPSSTVILDSLVVSGAYVTAGAGGRSLDQRSAGFRHDSKLHFYGKPE